MALLAASIYLYVTLLLVPRLVYRRLANRPPLLKIGLTASTAFLLTLGPFLPDGYYIYRTQVACTSQSPFTVYKRMNENELAYLKHTAVTLNRGIYTQRTFTGTDKRTGEKVYSTYVFTANAPGPFSFLLQDKLRIFHPFTPEKTYPYFSQTHVAPMLKSIKGNNK